MLTKRHQVSTLQDRAVSPGLVGEGVDEQGEVALNKWRKQPGMLFQFGTLEWPRTMPIPGESAGLP
ncbi:hypothetical protein [Chitinolyticbacter albus]|uniref:hypothetical protein n=1 Tax=Chitinolyticbacter albus TaxID=2961951 RepID=UPI00210A6091|nr:hypothetical protein [Chitinolyticbacter albus]